MLDRALADLASREPRVTIDPDARAGDFDRVLDASGRPARPARRVPRAEGGWVARVRCFEGHYSPAERALRTAALPFGYAYRLATPTILSFGLVAPKHLSSAADMGWTELLGGCGARWITDGVDEKAGLDHARGGACSFQWAEPNCAELIGDAAFAPDILAGQGLSRAIAAGLAVRGVPAAPSAIAGLASAHLRDAIATHAAKLDEIVAHSRWRSSASWAAYRRSVAELAELAARTCDLAAMAAVA
jgi:hypothetical protein